MCVTSSDNPLHSLHAKEFYLAVVIQAALLVDVGYYPEDRWLLVLLAPTLLLALKLRGLAPLWVLAGSASALTLISQVWFFPAVSFLFSLSILCLILLTACLVSWLKISQKKLGEKEQYLSKVQASEFKFRGMTQSSPLGLFELDAQGRFLFVNPAWEKITGYSLTRVLGKPWDFLLDDRDRNQVLENWKEPLNQGGDFSETFRLINPRGEAVWLQLRMKSLFHDEGHVIVGAVADITEQKREEEKKEALIQELLDLKTKLEESARTDPLTGICNRRGMKHQLQLELARVKRFGRIFSILLIDIDHFKMVNDTYGHETGDTVLTGVAQCLAETCRAQDIVSRWGGEEFLILLPETDQAGAMVVADKLRLAVQSLSFRHGGKPFSVTISLGVATFDPSLDLQTCIRRADEALYKAKKQGRNQTVAWDHESSGSSAALPRQNHPN